jgi:ribosomal-protein-alanine N-acetyltransferase
VSVTRLITLEDAAALAELLRVNREFLAPWNPAQPDGYATADAQRAAIGELLGRYEQGAALPHVILDSAGGVAGRITLSGIVRGSFQSCAMGFWLSEARNGRGLASAAVAEIISVAFGELGLHRIQAETLLHNTRSQRVLERNGFARIGMAPAYLKIAGRWQDHVMFQLINPAADGERG